MATYTGDCKFKIATGPGDTFTDSSSNDVIINASDGTATRSFLAGFSSSAIGAIAQHSAVRISSNMLQVQGSVYASNIGIGTSNPIATLDVAGSTNFRSNVFGNSWSNVGGVAYASNINAIGIVVCQTLSNIGNAAVAGTLVISSNLQVNGTLSNVGNTNIGSNLSVGQNLTTTSLTCRSLSNLGNTFVGSNISCAGTLAATNIGLFRNRIINGDMRIDQRASGLIQSGLSNTIGQLYVADRFGLSISSNSTSNTSQQFVNIQQMPLSNVSQTSFSSMAQLGQSFTNCVMIQAGNSNPTTNVIGGEFLVLSHHIEALHMSDLAWGTQNAVPLVLSFFVYCGSASAAGTYSACLRNYSTSVSQTIVSTFSVSNLGAWQRVVITFPGNTAVAWPTDNSLGLSVDITLLAGPNNYVSSPGVWQSGASNGIIGMSNFMSTTNNTLYFTGIQLERGTMVTPFEYRPIQTELRFCQRYCTQLSATNSNQRLVPCIGFSNQSNGGLLTGLYQYPVAMRAVPVLSTNIGSNFATSGLGVNLPVVGSNSLTLNTIDTTNTVASIQGTYTSVSTQTPSYFAGFYTSSNIGHFLQFNAEL